VYVGKKIHQSKEQGSKTNVTKKRTRMCIPHCVCYVQQLLHPRDEARFQEPFGTVLPGQFIICATSKRMGERQLF
jgi:hypothetical protein